MAAIQEIAKLMWHFTEKADQARIATLALPTHVTEYRNLAYCPDGHPMHQLDVYLPEGTDAPLPVVIDVHGGGWMYGDKELNKPYCLHLAARGNVVFNLSYRLAPEVTVNEQLLDVMTALQWIGDHLGDYPCKTNEILLTGDSAGGQLAAYAAALLNSPALREVFNVPAPALKLTALALTAPVAYMDAGGLVGAYTRSMWGADYKAKPTYAYMNLNRLLEETTLPPTFLVTSSGDIMALKQTRRAANDIARHGIQTEFMDFPTFEGEDLPHVFSVIHPESKAAKLTLDRMFAFFKAAIEKEETV